MKKYFRYVPDFDYVSRLPESKISDYVKVKNLFKKGKLRDDIFQDVTVFTKYQIVGDARPDNVAYDVYNNADLDWVILLSNNIVNIQTEWPLPQNDFDKILLERYKTYENLYGGIQQQKQLDNLKKQAEEATRYKEISNEIKKVEAGLYYLKVREIEIDKKKLTKN